jgi:hypothetical protein
VRPLRPLSAVLVAAAVTPATLFGLSGNASASSGPSISGLALANLGNKACSKNSLGGRGFDSSCTGDGGKPEYWCADFARWVWANSGVAGTSMLSAEAGSFYKYGLDHGTLTAKPALGDVAVYNYSDGSAEHVAVVTKVNPNGSIETVSGDWGGESGSETHFASTSSVDLNAPAYSSTLGSVPPYMGMTLSAFVAPAGVAVSSPVSQTVFGPNKTLRAGGSITSPNGKYTVKLTRTGRLAERSESRRLWIDASRDATDSRAVMQRDGNLVVYTASGVPLWASGTAGHGGASLFLSDSGKMTVARSGSVLWTRSGGNAG